MRLEKFQDQIQNFILNSIEEAKIEFDDINSIGIYISPINGWISSNFNDNSKVENTDFNCPDFDRVEFSLLNIDDWVLESEKPNPIFTFGGEQLLCDDENEKLNAFIFKYFVSYIMPLIVEQFQQPILIQMLDSNYVYIWNAKDEVVTKFESLNEIFEPEDHDIVSNKFFKWVKKLFN